jgi:hypothetical protein
MADAATRSGLNFVDVSIDAQSAAQCLNHYVVMAMLF